jgi:hypothetical protein
MQGLFLRTKGGASGSTWTSWQILVHVASLSGLLVPCKHFELLVGHVETPYYDKSITMSAQLKGGIDL